MSQETQLLSVIIGLLVGQAILGLALVIKAFWEIRFTLVVLQMALVGTIVSFIALNTPLYVAILSVIVQAYIAFHLLRFIKSGANRQLVIRRAIRTQLILGAFALGAVAIWRLQAQLDMVAGLVLIQLFVAAWLLLHTINSYRRTKLLLPKNYKSDSELPTLTVAIPARNETGELTDMLEALLKSDYPKLEILVLDDCSQDNTSDIIRSFAHRGVRFVKGLEVDNKWLAKNHAYDQLMDAASGHYILFCGVDVRFDKKSLRLLMGEMTTNKIGMMCVLPLRPAEVDYHYLLQPMRYWRELAIPRINKTTPPSLSTCWVADRKALQKLGGFEGLRRTIRPERFIARSFAVKAQYWFVRSSQQLGIKSVKSLPAQWQTALRTRYPELRSQPENVLFTSLWQAMLLLGPFVGFVYGLMTNEPLVLAICLTSVGLLGIVQGLVFYMTTGKLRPGSAALVPLSILMELVVINYSMWAYEYSKVLWKGRNVCIPVLRAIPALPKSR